MSSKASVAPGDVEGKAVSPTCYLVRGIRAGRCNPQGGAFVGDTSIADSHVPSLSGSSILVQCVAAVDALPSFSLDALSVLQGFGHPIARMHGLHRYAVALSY